MGIVFPQGNAKLNVCTRFTTTHKKIFQKEEQNRGFFALSWPNTEVKISCFLFFSWMKELHIYCLPHRE